LREKRQYICIKDQKREIIGFNSYTATVASWRVIKPIYNREVCIDCPKLLGFWGPDTSIYPQGDKPDVQGIDYDHCQRVWEVLVEVCPTKSQNLYLSSLKLKIPEGSSL